MIRELVSTINKKSMKQTMNKRTLCNRCVYGGADICKAPDVPQRVFDVVDEQTPLYILNAALAGGNVRDKTASRKAAKVVAEKTKVCKWFNPQNTDVVG